MTVALIPFPAGPYWSQTVTLDGVDYLITCAYNFRKDRYYLSISDAAGNKLASGKALVCNWPLFSSCRIEGLFPGVLAAVPQSANDSDPKLGEIGDGKRVELVYYDAASIAQYKATGAL